jgi:alanyl-tRNA synthetase
VINNTSVQAEVMAIADAKAKGAMALFGEKYGDSVRVLTMGQENFSIELCGGTHVSRTGDIGVFKITSEGGVASGVRRIEAKTGFGALAYIRDEESVLSDIAQQVRGSHTQTAEKVRALVEHAKSLEKELDRLKQKLAASAGDDLLQSAINVSGINVLSARLDGIDAKALRDTMDQLRNKLGRSVVALATVADGKISLVVGVSQDLVSTIKAGELVGNLAAQVGGKGGGRPDMAQAGGTDVAKLAEALASVKNFVEGRI